MAPSPFPPFCFSVRQNESEVIPNSISGVISNSGESRARCHFHWQTFLAILFGDQPLCIVHCQLELLVCHQSGQLLLSPWEEDTYALTCSHTDYFPSASIHQAERGEERKNKKRSRPGTMGNTPSVRPNGRPVTQEPQLHFYSSHLLRDRGFCSKVLLHPHAVFGCIKKGLSGKQRVCTVIGQGG